MLDEEDFFGYGPDMDFDGDVDLVDYLIMDDILTDEEKEAEDSFSNPGDSLFSDDDEFDDDEFDDDEFDDEEDDEIDHSVEKKTASFQRMSSTIKSYSSNKTEAETSEKKAESETTDETETPPRITLERFKKERKVLITSFIASFAVWIAVTLVAWGIAHIALSVDTKDIMPGVVSFFNLLFGGGAVLVILFAGYVVYQMFSSDRVNYEYIKEKFYKEATKEELAALKRNITDRKIVMFILVALIAAVIILAFVNRGQNGSSDARETGYRTENVNKQSQTGYNSSYGSYNNAGSSYYKTAETASRTYNSSGANKSSKSGGASTKPSYDPRVAEFSHPEDFYEWYYDDFFDYEEAEEYYYSHGRD